MHVDPCRECAELKGQVETLRQLAESFEAQLACATAAQHDNVQDTAPTAARNSSHDDSVLLQRLETDNAQLQETVRQLMDDIASRDRALKRNESVAKETIRAKEKQIVQQSSQLSEYQAQIQALADTARQREEELRKERQRVMAVEGRAQDGQFDSTTMQLQAQRIIDQQALQVSSLEKAIAELQRQCEDGRRRLTSAEETAIRLECDLQQRNATIASLRESLDSERRLALVRQQQQQQRGHGSAEVAPGVMRRQRSSNNDVDSAAAADIRDVSEATDPALPQSPIEPTPSLDTSATEQAPALSAAQLRDMFNLESMLRAKDQQVIRLSNDVVKLRAEVSSKQLAIAQLSDEKNTAEVMLASLKSTADEHKRRLDEATADLNRRMGLITELRGERNAKEEALLKATEANSRLQRQVEELRSEEDAYRSFRIQHVDCQARLVDKDLAIFQTTTALSDAKRLLEKAYTEIEALTHQIHALKAEVSQARDEGSMVSTRSEARVSAFEMQLAEWKKCVHELEEKLSARNEAYEQLSSELTSVRALRDEERETWRTKTHQSQQAFQQLQSSQQKLIDQHQQRETKLLEQIQKLQAENNALIQTKRDQESHVLHLSEALKREQESKVVGMSGRTGDLKAVGDRDTDGPNRRPSLHSPTAAEAASTRSGDADDAQPASPAGGVLRRAGNTSSNAASGSVAAATSLQRVSLELEEMRQKFNKLQREYAAREQDIENLWRRLREAEGTSGGDGTTSSASEQKRLVGMLESLSVEISNQLARHLKGDYMRGGLVTTLPAVVAAFHLGKDEGAELMDALSRLMIMVRCRIALPVVCQRLQVKEQSIRRVMNAFSKCGASVAASSSSRRNRLLAGSPPAARYNFAGHERLQLMLCSRVRNAAAPSCDDEDDVSSEASSSQRDAPKSSGSPRSSTTSALSTAPPVTRLGRDAYVVALICSYLPVVLRGNTAFAAHVLSRSSSSTRQSGQTLLLSLDPTDNTFTMMECEVASSRCIIVVISGVYKAAFSWQTCSHVKVSLQCRTKRDGILASPGGDAAAKSSWKWSDVEKIPRDESSIITYTIKKLGGDEAMTEGLVAETNGVRLRELSIEEVGLIQELYSGDLDSAQAMQEHRSWDAIPAPPPSSSSKRQK